MVLNGAPRSGKSAIAVAIQAVVAAPWVNLGVDVVRGATPPGYQPGIGLRPGAERPDLESFVEASFAALYESVAAHARHGLNVVVDVGHHDGYSRPLGTLRIAGQRLNGLAALLVGVRCPIEVIMERRAATGYLATGEGRRVPEPVTRWQVLVHQPGIYDLELDTSQVSPEEAAAVILARLAGGPPPDAFARILAARQ